MFRRIRRDALRLEIEILDARCDTSGLHRTTGLLTGRLVERLKPFR